MAFKPTAEFDLIARYFTKPTPSAVLGVGDDCALLSVKPEHELAVSTDALLSGVHFFSATDPRNLGHKALAVNLSDLAAMGATPRWFTLALTLPEIDHAWLQAFSTGLLTLAAENAIELVGGDTTRGPLSMTLTVMGEIPQGKALRRDAAKTGEDIWVSGTLGDAALGLRCIQGRIALTQTQRAYAVDRLERPQPRVELGLRLRDLASSAIDISDGLLADLGHICERSRLGARIEYKCVPMSSALRGQDAAVITECVLAGGDDYELCFTAPPAARGALAVISSDLGLALTRIGTLLDADGVTVIGENGQPLALTHSGYDHFAPT